MSVQPPPFPFPERLARDKELVRDLFARLDRGEEVDFETLRGALGVKLAPTTWEELRELLADGSDEALATLGRSPAGLREYFSYCGRVIARQFASTTDYLFCKVFGVPARAGDDGRQVAILPADFYDSLRIVWRLNDFPYCFEEGMEHHVVWSNRPLLQGQLEQVILEHRQGYETLHYINPPAVMSVPTIWHAHVISRPEKRA